MESAAKLVSSLNKLKKTIPLGVEGSPHPNLGGAARTALKLPHVPLPEYSHREGEDIHKFLLNFESVIGKYELS